jgi:hypothetical protein
MIQLNAARLLLADIINNHRFPKAWGKLKRKYCNKLADLFLNALREQRRPYAAHATIWLEDGRTISDLTDFIGKWVRANPVVKNGTRQTTTGKTQKYRKRPRCLYMWTQEEKDVSAVDCHHETGLHVHMILCVDAHSYHEDWPEFIMGKAQEAGIIAAHDLAYKVTGHHLIQSEADLKKAFSHSAYVTKLEQKDFREAGRNMGSSLCLLPMMQDDRFVIEAH